MADFDFENIQPDGEVQWYKKGRHVKPVPEALAKALHSSFETGATPNLVIKKEQLRTFYNLLGSAGGKLNYRIERTWTDHPDDPDLAIVYFRVNGRRKNNVG